MNNYTFDDFIARYFLVG